MKAGVRTAMLVAALGAGGTSVVSAQTSAMHIGPQIAYDFDIEEMGLGAQFSVPIMRRLEFYPSFMYYFVDPGSFWNLNADLKWRVASDRPNWLYLGAGLNLARAAAGGESNTDAGLNILAGAESLKGRIHPFAEARLILGDGSRFQLAAGLNITISGH